jgi:hypothetical protein
MRGSFLGLCCISAFTGVATSQLCWRPGSGDVVSELCVFVRVRFLVTLSLRRIAIAWRNRSSAAVGTAAAKFGGTLTLEHPIAGNSSARYSIKAFPVIYRTHTFTKFCIQKRLSLSPAVLPGKSSLGIFATHRNLGCLHSRLFVGRQKHQKVASKTRRRSAL